MAKEMVRKASGTPLGDYYPKAALVGEGFVLVPAVEDVPEAYDYIFEPEVEAVDGDVFVARTSEGTVVLKVFVEEASELTVLSTTPVEGGTLNYSLPGGTPPAVVDDAIVVTFSENIAAVDTSLITLGTNTNPTDLSGATFSVVGDTLSITGITSVPEGTTSFTLTIPVGAVAGSPSGAMLGADFVATYVGLFVDGFGAM